ncbi:unnamed protein product [Ambrosiozyma monospora]|uniref:Unnamed protein product n=1 Tax=Ambrosiozyma monospora TaxID=43982 RepID=A0A9W6YLZ5_AMBMO|nr:unnamed protein product [Ambrosiozyma monospora]
MVEKEEYLQPGFAASSLTVPQLRSVLADYNISYNPSGKKRELVALFEENIGAKSEKLLKEYTDALTAHSDMDIVEVKLTRNARPIRRRTPPKKEEVSIVLSTSDEDEEDHEDNNEDDDDDDDDNNNNDGDGDADYSVRSSVNSFQEELSPVIPSKVVNLSPIQSPKYEKSSIPLKRSAVSEPTTKSKKKQLRRRTPVGADDYMDSSSSPPAARSRKGLKSDPANDSTSSVQNSITKIELPLSSPRLQEKIQTPNNSLLKHSQIIDFTPIADTATQKKDLSDDERLSPVGTPIKQFLTPKRPKSTMSTQKSKSFKKEEDLEKLIAEFEVDGDHKTHKTTIFTSSSSATTPKSSTKLTPKSIRSRTPRKIGTPHKLGSSTRDVLSSPISAAANKQLHRKVKTSESKVENLVQKPLEETPAKNVEKVISTPTSSNKTHPQQNTTTPSQRPKTPSKAISSSKKITFDSASKAISENKFSHAGPNKKLFFDDTKLPIPSKGSKNVSFDETTYFSVISDESSNSVSLLNSSELLYTANSTQLDQLNETIEENDESEVKTSSILDEGATNDSSYNDDIVDDSDDSIYVNKDYKQKTFDFLKRASLFLLAATTIGSVWTLREIKFNAGYCNITPQNQQLDIWSKVPKSLQGPQLEPYVHQFESYFDEQFQFECEPCPNHATCYPDSRIKCDSNYVIGRPWMSLLGLVPNQEYCVRDTLASDKMKYWAQYTLSLLHRRQGEQLSLDELHDLLKDAKSPSMTDLEFEEYWLNFIHFEMLNEPEIKIDFVTSSIGFDEVTLPQEYATRTFGPRKKRSFLKPIDKSSLSSDFDSDSESGSVHATESDD